MWLVQFFLDLQKAFDTVNHNILQSKFGQFNFSQFISNWFKSYLNTHVLKYKIQHLSSKISSQVSPKVQSFQVQGCEVIMYVDDTVIFVKGKDHSEAAAQLTKVMVNISNWLNNCHLQFDSSKTVAMFFAKTNKSYTEPDVFLYLDRESKL